MRPVGWAGGRSGRRLGGRFSAKVKSEGWGGEVADRCDRLGPTRVRSDQPQLLSNPPRSCWTPSETWWSSPSTLRRMLGVGSAAFYVAFLGPSSDLTTQGRRQQAPAPPRHALQISPTLVRLPPKSSQRRRSCLAGDLTRGGAICLGGVGPRVPLAPDLLRFTDGFQSATERAVKMGATRGQPASWSTQPNIDRVHSESDRRDPDPVTPPFLEDEPMSGLAQPWPDLVEASPSAVQPQPNPPEMLRNQAKQWPNTPPESCDSNPPTGYGRCRSSVLCCAHMFGLVARIYSTR